MGSTTSAQLKGWIPYNIKFIESRPVVEWLFTGKYRFTDPFFEDTTRKCRSLQENKHEKIGTSIEKLSELKEQCSSCLPAGFIFHTSRCGSTLISQMLAELPQNIVISEAPPVDTILRTKLKANISDEQRAEWLVDLLTVLGQKRFKEEKNLFIKFDSWHILDFKFISTIFPTVPSIFLYREPIEVLTSHVKIKGSFMVPGIIEPEWFGWNYEWIKSTSFDEFGVEVLRKIYETGLSFISTKNSLAVNYLQLPGLAWTKLKDFFHLECTEEDINKMKETSRYYSKTPSLNFSDMPKPEMPAVSEHVQQLSEKYVTPIYNELETVRNSS